MKMYPKCSYIAFPQFTDIEGTETSPKNAQ